MNHDRILDGYRRSLDVMSSAVRTADPEKWDHQSPCDDWTARQVVGHAVTFVANVVKLAVEDPGPDFHAAVDFATIAGEHPDQRWERAREEIERELLCRTDRLERVRMTPLGVEMPMAEMLTFQGMDPVVHGWDVAVTTGGRVDIPADLATAYPERFAPVSDQIRAAGLLGPETDAADDPVERLLAFCGRVRP